MEQKSMDLNKIKLKDSGESQGSEEMGPVSVKTGEEATGGEQQQTQEQTPAEQGEEQQQEQPQQQQSSPQPQGEQTDQQRPQAPPWQQAIKARGFEDVETFLSEFDKIRQKAQKMPDLDEFGQRLLDSYLEGEDEFRKVVEKVAIDPSKLSDKEVIRRSIMNEYPHAKDEQINFLLKEELKQLGFSEDATEEEQQNAQMRLQLKADTFRGKMKEQQEEFKNKSMSEEERLNYYMQRIQPIVEKQTYQQRQQEVQNLTTSEAWQNVYNNKTIQVKYTAGNGQKQVANYKVEDPEKLGNMIVDMSNLAKALTNPDGSPNYDLALKVAAYAADPEGFERTMIQVGKSYGTDQTLDAVTNASMPDNEDKTGDEKGKPQSKSEEVKNFLEAALLAKNKNNR